jgi:hypothetical protein
VICTAARCVRAAPTRRRQRQRRADSASAADRTDRQSGRPAISWRTSSGPPPLNMRGLCSDTLRGCARRTYVRSYLKRAQVVAGAGACARATPTIRRPVRAAAAACRRAVAPSDGRPSQRHKEEVRKGGRQPCRHPGRAVQAQTTSRRATWLMRRQGPLGLPSGPCTCKARGKLARQQGISGARSVRHGSSWRC